MPQVAQVHMDVVPDAAHVRVVRLVAVSLARLHGVPEDVVEDVRLAVGEACARAVAAHRRHDVDQPVKLGFEGGPGLKVAVTDGVALPAASGDEAVRLLLAGPDDQSPDADSEAAPAVMALLEGLAEQVSVHTGHSGTRIVLGWGAGR